MGERHKKIRSLRTEDLTGKRFGKLLVLGRSEAYEPGGYPWMCRCDCGQEVLIKGENIRGGQRTSCGNHRSEAWLTHGMSNTPEFNAWKSAIRRCENKNLKCYHRYGGRGITFFEGWRHSFQAFFEHMGEKPEGYQLDRIDNDGNYEPGNCRWASRKENSRNRGNNVFIECNGESRTAPDWAEVTGISKQVIEGRFSRGWTPREILGFDERPKTRKRKIKPQEQPMEILEVIDDVVLEPVVDVASDKP